MTTQRDGISLVLTNRVYLYKLLQRFFGSEPSFELIEIAASDHTKEALQLILNEDQNAFDSYLVLLEELNKAISFDAEGTLDKLRSEYTTLMVGPNNLPAPPWESVYRTKERIIFQECTLEVRRAYLEYNFLPEKYLSEADDHLALELDFVAHLANLSQSRFEEANYEEVKKLLSDQKAFLDQHLLLWIGDFAEQMQLSGRHDLYPQMALLTEQVLKIDAFVLDELISWLGHVTESRIIK